MKNLSLIHKNTYNTLAAEYESRTEILRPITENAISFFAAYVKPCGEILDIGCAVGLVLNVLNKKGFKTTGIEISPEIIKYAKKRNFNSEIITGDSIKKKLNKKFDGAVLFAFIHLFPKKQVPQILKKVSHILKPKGVALISSTESLESKEGWYIKTDLNKKEKRFRKFWTEQELKNSIEKAGFKVLNLNKYKDSFGKVWMDFIVPK